MSHPKFKLILKIFLLLIALILVVIFLWKWQFSPTQPAVEKELTNPLSSVQKASSFPVYYPENLPDEVQLNDESLSTSSNLVMFSYKIGVDEQIIVTQQPKPPIMESVKKTREFKTSIGEAYIADLEGKITGFIITDTTLIILSNADKSHTDTLEQIMTNFKPL